MSAYNENFAKMLHSTRLKKGLSQKEVAEALNISRSTYAYYESGKVMPGLEQIRGLKKALHLSLRAIFYPERHIHKRVLRKWERAVQETRGADSQK